MAEEKEGRMNKDQPRAPYRRESHEVLENNTIISHFIPGPVDALNKCLLRESFFFPQGVYSDGGRNVDKTKICL